MSHGRYPVNPMALETNCGGKPLGNKRSEERYETIIQEIIPRLTWKWSNLPERISHKAREIRNVIKNGPLFAIVEWGFLLLTPAIISLSAC